MSLIIQLALDQLFEMTQIDPASYFPDDSLQEDLGLSADQVLFVLNSSAAKLDLPEFPSDFSKLPHTVRQFVELLAAQQQSAGLSESAA